MNEPFAATRRAAPLAVAEQADRRHARAGDRRSTPTVARSAANEPARRAVAALAARRAAGRSALRAARRHRRHAPGAGRPAKRRLRRGANACRSSGCSRSTSRRSPPRRRVVGDLLTLRDLTESRRVERMRVDFIANASHELRTPLASLLGFIETLQGSAHADAGGAGANFSASCASRAAAWRG